ncbi:MAG: hypothetical protein H6753_07175 [Candidatus Omnitrophica bacterium]|nr:hypothetical protein [Candidatus Omnitrophota bacterium]
MNNTGNRSFFENAKAQLWDRIWEIFFGILAILFGLSFIDTFGIYILLIVLVGFPIAVIAHNTKLFPVITLLIGVAFGMVIGSQWLFVNTNLPINANPTEALIEQYQIVDEEQSIGLDEKISILEGFATIRCTWVYEGLGWADCEFTEAGQSVRNITLKIEKDFSVTINGKVYSIVLLDATYEQVRIKTIYIPPSLYTPTPYPSN